MTDITSASNAKVKYIRSLAQKKAREENGEYTVEGIKSVRDALASDRAVTAIYASETFCEAEKLDFDTKIPFYRVTDGVFGKMCDTKAPQGILAVIKAEDGFEPEKDGAYIYCDNINDPGNLGTIIRTADAAGFDGVMLSPGCVDLYNPKTVRASMGSFFHIKTARGVGAETLRKYGEKGFTILGGALSDKSADYRCVGYELPLIIVVGNEANGISDEVLKICTPVKIPISGRAESLNAGVAAAILMYEAMRANENKGLDNL